MTNHITQEQAVELAKQFGIIDADGRFDMDPTSTIKQPIEALCNAAIQSYIDQRAKELPVLPEPYCEGTKLNIPNAIPDLFTLHQLQAYGQQCAAHAREVALSEVAQMASNLRAFMGSAACAAFDSLKAGK